MTVPGETQSRAATATGMAAVAVAGGPQAVAVWASLHLKTTPLST
jgi:hypothetical protein